MTRFDEVPGIFDQRRARLWLRFESLIPRVWRLSLRFRTICFVCRLSLRFGVIPRVCRLSAFGFDLADLTPLAGFFGLILATAPSSGPNEPFSLQRSGSRCELLHIRTAG